MRAGVEVVQLREARDEAEARQLVPRDEEPLEARADLDAVEVLQLVPREVQDAQRRAPREARAQPREAQAAQGQPLEQLGVVLAAVAHDELLGEAVLVGHACCPGAARRLALGPRFKHVEL